MQEIKCKNKSVKIENGVIVEVAESSLDSALFSQGGLPRRFAESARNDGFLDSAHPTHDANSSIVDEKSGLCSCEREDRTNGSSTKRATNLPDLSPQDEFATLIPQFIDLNVFPKNKSLSRNSILSLAKKAKVGGVGIIALNSALNPAIDNEMAIEFIKNISSEVVILPLIASNAQSAESRADSANLAQDLASDFSEGKICDIAILNTLGGVGINLNSAKSANTIDKVAKYAKMLDIPLFINANDNLGGVINYGQISAELGIPARNPLSEIKEVAKMLEVAIFYDLKVVFSAISEIRSLELISQAKKHNPRIFTEVSAHHLLLNDEACRGYNTSAKINPPLKDKSAQERLLQALKDGEIDVLTSLQCAVFNSKKDLPFGSAEYGIDCVSHYFALLYSNLVAKNIISLERLCALCAENPAKILGLNCGKIEKGKEARLMIVDLDSAIKVNDAFSPYNGAELQGQILRFTRENI